MNFRNFFAELKRRNVYKVAVAYAVVAWLLIQAASILFPTFEAPSWVMKVFVAVVALGFPVALLIAWAFELTPEGLRRTDAGESLPPRKRSQAWIYVVLVGAAVSVGLFFLGRYTGPNRPAAVAESSAKSIAVLPFENLSRDPDNAYFADGIQDEILTRLAKIGDLKVISRTSTHRYKSSPEDLPKIAQQLGVAHILEGSVQKSGEQVRVTVQLIRAATDSHLWAETYDRKLTDIFAVESEVAENIAKSLRAQLTGAEKKAVAAKPTENAEAYEAYLRGLALWNKLQTSSQEVEKTFLYFARATQLDPKFALAWASRSAVQSFTYGDLDRTPERLAEAKESLDVALRLDPESSETQFALGLYRYRGLKDYEGALAAFQKARLRGGGVGAIEFSAYVKRRQGKWDEALALHAESIELDPRNPIILSEAALSYRALRRFDEALALWERASEIEPTSEILLVQKAETYLAKGETEKAAPLIARVPLDGQEPRFFLTRIRFWILMRQYSEAIRAARDVLEAPESLPPSSRATYRAWLGIAESLAGNQAAARTELSRAYQELSTLRAQQDETPSIVRDLIRTSGFLRDKAEVDRLAAEFQGAIRDDAVDGPGIEAAVAVARAQLGETDAAIAILQRLLLTYGEESLTRALLRLDPLWDPLRSDPRFQKLANPNP